jgi:pullulanase
MRRVRRALLGAWITAGAVGGVAAGAAHAASVTLTVTAPECTPADAALHVAGDFQGWNPGDPSHRLTRAAGGRWTITLDLPEGRTVELKITRGSWMTVEKGPAGEEIPNRSLRVHDGDRHELVIANWADLGPAPPPHTSTLTGDVFTMSFPDFLSGRRVWIWLPPGYASSETRYPVLYFWDGQNVFDAATSFAGEWHADETLAAMIAGGGVRPLIAVGIDHGGEARLHEYSPWSDPGRGGGGGHAHLRAVIENLKPRVDSLFRTLPGPETTGICGSSLGGLMAVYAAFAAPETFGRAAGLSVVFSWAEGRLASLCASSARPGIRLYVDTGTLEEGRPIDADGNGTDDHVDGLRALRAVLLAEGFREGVDLMTVEDGGGRHHESAWSRRLPAALEFLFPAE